MQYKLYLGQTTEAPFYYCNQDNSKVKFALRSSSHSAHHPTTNCSLQECLGSSINGNECRSPSTPCFDYRTFNNTRYCAPAFDCSVMEACDNSTLTCTSSTSECVINSCCSSQAVCLPLVLTNFCRLGNYTISAT
jgi:hypothetical protein